MSIGETSVASGVKIPTIRYYEQIGLLPEGKRDRGNRRRYDHAAVHRLQFIRTARELGFEVEAIREFLRIMATPELQTPDTARIAQAQLLCPQQDRPAGKAACCSVGRRRWIAMRKCDGPAPSAVAS